MANEIARHFANSKNTLVVAPAGCGKTHLIADAVMVSSGRQLVLTHTHAGVRAIIDHLKRRKVSSEQYRVATIDSFALRYANAFPSLSQWTQCQPEGNRWAELRPAAQSAFQYAAIRRVLKASYSGLYVDEYQDCTNGQHELIKALSDILPTRIVGDPLQSIFWKINKTDLTEWRDVETVFTRMHELTEPHRWRGINDALGDWLLEVRTKLICGDGISLRDAPIVWDNDVSSVRQRRACLEMIVPSQHSLLGLHKWAGQCHHIARYLNGAYNTMETVECEDLQEWARRFQSSKDTVRASHILGFVKVCLGKLPPAVNNWIKSLEAGRIPKTRLANLRKVLATVEKVVHDDDLHMIDHVLEAFEGLTPSPLFVRRELWREMRRSLQEFRRSKDQTLQEVAWHIRNRTRHIGRRVDRRCLSTTLLVKGLQFDHVAILDASEMEDAENLYVAMTRGSRSLVILSEHAVLRRHCPHYATADGMQ